jgi:TPR repeat protein
MNQPSQQSQPPFQQQPPMMRPQQQPPPQQQQPPSMRPQQAVQPVAAPPPPADTRRASNQSAAEEPPITIAELNQLREQFKDRPTDFALGLRFAKRLVEAAKVLSSENGRADPKTTLRNRERYINDAHKVVKKMVNAGSVDAMFYLADCFGQGSLGLPVDAKEAFQLYQSAAKLNHAQSAYRVAVCCELGHEEGGGTRRDPMKAIQWYKRAATLGDTPAMYKMGMILLKGLLGQPRNPREAVSWLKRAAERADKENPHALHELGLLYESARPEDHILRDEGYAYQLFLQAAELGYKYSQFRLGSAYEYAALGCPIDQRQSIAWYSRAASQGEHQAELALSGWYLTGAGDLVQQNDQEAYLWARKAAMSGLAKAEFAMGYFAEVGIGCTVDPEEARRWYYRAAGK